VDPLYSIIFLNTDGLRRNGERSQPSVWRLHRINDVLSRQESGWSSAQRLVDL
jgi:hypothetical protein